MSEPSKYWNLVRIDAAEASGGYKIQPMPLAQQFFQAQFLESVRRSSLADTSTQMTLLQWSQAEAVAVNAIATSQPVKPSKQRSTDSNASSTQLKALLCLRCYISHPILQACIKRARIFSMGNRFTYRDLLPFVLNDDGRISLTYTPFSVEILQSFQPQRSSLTGWVDVRVKRHPELNQFLLECGLRISSDWAVLNRANPHMLSACDRSIVEAFHAIYRHQRSQQRHGNQRCPDPTEAQLHEMIQYLQRGHSSVTSPKEMMNQLKRVATHLRHEAIWGQRGAPLAESLELTDPETGDTIERDIPDPVSPMDIVEEKERSHLQAFCADQLLRCLDNGIQQGIGDRIASLQKRPRYAHLATQIQPALRLLYFEGKSQGQIATCLGMANQSQVSRVLDLKGLLVDIRRRTLEKLLDAILKEAQALGLIDIPAKPDYLDNLIQQLDQFVDEKVFREAAAEISNSKNRAMTSFYAQRIRQALEQLNR
jgi:hypothetical protein